MYIYVYIYIYVDVYISIIHVLDMDMFMFILCRFDGYVYIYVDMDIWMLCLLVGSLKLSCQISTSGLVFHRGYEEAPPLREGHVLWTTHFNQHKNKADQCIESKAYQNNSLDLLPNGVCKRQRQA